MNKNQSRPTVKLSIPEALELYQTFGLSTPMCKECGGHGHSRNKCPTRAKRGHYNYLYHPCCADPRQVCLRCDGFGHNWEECTTSWERVFPLEGNPGCGLYHSQSTQILAQMRQHKIYSFFGDCELSRMRTSTTRPSPRAVLQRR